MLEFGDIVTLENDKKYLVASTCDYNSKLYVYLVNMENNVDCILASLHENDLEQVTDTDLFVKIMPLILDNANDEILNGENENE